MAATELAKAYIQLVPSAKGIKGAIKNQIDPEAQSAGKSGGAGFASMFKKVIAGAAIGAAVGKIFKDSIGEGAQLQQSLGGVETLFKDSAGLVKQYANEAYRTVGLSANDYMENVTGFSASLLQSMGGDTKKAAKVADMAMIDMADNANKMGTDMGSIQTAYQGFAKQNYTMLDNLKLGYGGTKSEMERLLKDATKLTGVKYDLDNLGDVYSAIHAIQEELDITGTTAKEANETLAGSLMAMQSAYQNVIGKLSIGQDVSKDLKALAQTASTFLFGNLLPMIGNVAKALPGALLTFAKAAIPEFVKAGKEFIAGIGKGMSGNTNFALLWLDHIVKFAGPRLADMVEQVLSRTDEIKQGFSRLKDSLLPIMQKLMGIFSGWAITATAVFSKAIPLAIDILLSVFNGLQTFLLPMIDKIIDVFWEFSGLVTGAILNYVVPAMQQFSQWISSNQGAMETLGKILGAVVVGFLAFKTISSVIGVISTVGTAVKGLMTAFSMIKSVAGLVALVKLGFTTMLTAIGGPVTIIIGIVAALVAAFVYLWKTNDDFKAAVINIWNGIVAFLTPIVSGIADFVKGVFTSLLDWWNTNQQGIFQKASDIWNTIYQTVSMVVTEVWNFVKNIFSILSNWWNANQQNILNTAKMIWNAIKVAIQIAIGAIQLVVTTVLTAIRVFWNTWGSTILALAKVVWNAIKSTFQSVLQSILTVVSSVMNQIRIVINTVMGVIQGIIKVVTGIISGNWSQVWSGMRQIVSSIMNGIKNTIGNVLDTAKALVSDKINAIKNFFKSIGDINLYQIGKDIIQGLINGVGSMIGAIGRKVSEITSGIKDKITGAFNIKSPSRWMRDFVGKNMMLGWGIGIDKNADNPLKAMGAVIKDVMNELADGTSGFDLIGNAVDSVKNLALTSDIKHVLTGNQAQLASKQSKGSEINITNNIQSATPLSERELARQQRLQAQQLAYQLG